MCLIPFTFYVSFRSPLNNSLLTDTNCVSAWKSPASLWWKVLRSQRKAIKSRLVLGLYRVLCFFLFILLFFQGLDFIQMFHQDIGALLVAEGNLTGECLEDGKLFDFLRKDRTWRFIFPCVLHDLWSERSLWIICCLKFCLAFQLYELCVFGRYLLPCTRIDMKTKNWKRNSFEK